ncbi:glycine zipper family protein [Aridibaculum aurantiacum]|uniref:glycine zipper family protein n=1 Tax=Aridibaculum aurantiacum TaxID=2810307 RepID=UPI001A977468|nr:YMGG-like glycine zipper-containing protein [Aridibaculum aurantiacum]
MKKIFSVVAFAAIFAACNSNTKTAEQSTATQQADTAGLAQFKEWKQQQEFLEQSRMYNGLNEQQNLQNVEAQAAPPREVVRERVIYRDRPAPRTTTRSSSASRSSSGTVASAPAQTQKKKGWSHAAKGTAIGAGSGAVVGAVVSKNKAAGAVIGGVVGGVGGYVIGRSKDKKEGRY